MRRLMKIQFLTALVLVSTLEACSTPQAVRTLSEEQVKTQEDLLKSQKAYFSVIEDFVENQISVTEELVSEATLEINAKYKKKALREIDPKDTSKTERALDELSESVLREQKIDQESLARVKGYHMQLKELHQHMIEALTTIVAAQKKLNEYIQLQKADEVAVGQLITIVGLERSEVEEAATVAANVYGEIGKYLEGGADK